MDAGGLLAPRGPCQKYAIDCPREVLPEAIKGVQYQESVGLQ